MDKTDQKPSLCEIYFFVKINEYQMHIKIIKCKCYILSDMYFLPDTVKN